MKWMDLLKLSGTDLLLFAILGVLIWLFLKDFNLTNRRSWGILLGLASLGGILAIRFFKRRNLLRELEEREKALKDVEKNYDRLKEEARITEENYKKAKKDLDSARRDAAKAVLSADDTHRKAIDAIEKEHQEMSTDELVLKSFEILGKKKKD